MVTLVFFKKTRLFGAVILAFLLILHSPQISAIDVDEEEEDEYDEDVVDPEERDRERGRDRNRDTNWEIFVDDDEAEEEKQKVHEKEEEIDCELTEKDPFGFAATHILGGFKYRVYNGVDFLPGFTLHHNHDLAWDFKLKAMPVSVNTNDVAEESVAGNQYSAGLQYNFIRDIRSHTRRESLGSSKKSDTLRVNYFTEYEHQKGLLAGLRLSAHSDASLFPGANRANFLPGGHSEPYETDIYDAEYQSFTFRSGIGASWINRYVRQCEGPYQEKSRNYRFNFYIDLLYSPEINFPSSEFTVLETESDERIELEGEIPADQQEDMFGVAGGLEYLVNFRHLTMAAYLEVGSRPHIRENENFMNIGIKGGYSFGSLR